MLPANGFAEILLNQAGSEMKRRLKLGDRAQEMDFACGAALLNAPAPLVGMFLQIRHTSTELSHDFEGRLNAGHGGAIEFHLFPHVPIERTRDEPLEAL